MDDTKAELGLEAIEELEEKVAPAESLPSFKLASNRIAGEQQPCRIQLGPETFITFHFSVDRLLHHTCIAL
jgi:hypothetical protein